ncbi:MAG: FAD-dependent oxidoreductase [Enterococcus lacertideformus]|uniref:FAD-dependent oxidoreductase n=1 Tax=Enterococcus lacertideformus TaxID=2771493 RepID=A0A931AWW4_9ENTE|nr:FAD-dependent oxidoreductase [Enterococcus lacertideformus]
MFDVIIIGGGLGGLTAGALLAKQGKKVLLLEQHFIVGGCSTAFKRKDYIMDVGLHEMDGIENLKHELFSQLDLEKKIELVKIPELFEVVLSNQKKITLPHGEENARQFLINKYPNDKTGINQFFTTLKKIQSEFLRLPNEGIKRNLLMPVFPLLFPYLTRTSKITVGEWMDKHITNEELKLVLTANFGYYSDNVYNLNMTYFAAGNAGYFLNGAWYIKGSGQNLSNALKNIILENKGQVLTGKKVCKLLTEKDAVICVEFKDSFNVGYDVQKVFSNHIISNIAISETADMLPQKTKQKLIKKYKNYTPATSLLTVYLGINKPNLKEYGVSAYSTFIQGKNVESLQDLILNDQKFDINEGFVFVDYGQIDSGLAPQGKTFACICTTDDLNNWSNLSKKDYIEKKKRVAKLLLEKLEKHYPNILESIEHIEVGTAQTIQNYIKTPNGTPYGFDQTIKQGSIKRPKLKSNIKGLYFAGSWTFPGGGFTGALLSGKLCAEKILQSSNWSTKPLEKQQIIDKRIVKLIDKKEIAQNTILLTIEKPENFNYLPGQYVELQIEEPKYQTLDLMHRALSIVSHPDEKTLSFAMRYSNSSYKQSIKELSKGDTVKVFGPMGHFGIRNLMNNIVFIVSGIGITPVIPILQELMKIGFKKKVYLIYSNKYEKDLVFDERLIQYKKELNFEYLKIFTRTPNGKRIDKELIRDKVSDLQKNDYYYYIVGSKNFNENIQENLKKLGIQDQNILQDDFY